MSKVYLLTREDYEDFEAIAVYIDKDIAEENRKELMAPVLAFRKLQKESGKYRPDDYTGPYYTTSESYVLTEVDFID